MSKVPQSSASGMRKRPKIEPSASKPAVECKLRLDLQSLYDEGTLADVRLNVVGTDPAGPAQSFSCHRAILAASSAYFKAIFTSNCRESGKSDVTLNDVDPGVFELIIRLCYGCPIVLDRTNVVGLMHAAEFYGIAQLRESCTAFFQQALPPAVYYELLDHAISIRCDRAHQLCIRALAKDFPTAMENPAFVRMSMDSLRAMLQDDALKVPAEEVVLQALVMWVERNLDVPAGCSGSSVAGGLGGENTYAREEVDELLHLVRWPWLSTAVLCSVQERYPCLACCAGFDRLLLQAFRFHALTQNERALMVLENVQFQPRSGMVLLGELLPEGLITDTTFVWNVRNFATLTQNDYSPEFTVNGHRWSIFMWPRRSCSQNGKEQTWVSLYLNSVDVSKRQVAQLPSYAFELTVKNYKDSSRSITREYEHAFDSTEVDWGLSRFVACSQVLDPSEGFLNMGNLTIVCAIHQMLEEEEPQANEHGVEADNLDT
mmetsp:Transcript_19017/g.60327  ORF Transcript_19017/g.60327 Transcript_19017/m.60327 type:complete len:488 (+) Transcript_19017:3-1466(+)